MNGAITCMRTVRIYGKTGGKPPVRYQAAIHVNGRSFRRWGRVAKGRFLVESARPFSGGDSGKQPFVHLMGQGG